MNRKLIIALVAILVAIGLAGVIWTNREKPVVAGPPLPSFDYAEADSWAVRPETKPPAVWEMGWAFDVLVLASDAALGTGDGDAVGRARTKAADLAATFDDIGEVYVPFLRESDLSGDLTAALTAYLANDNRGRALLVATDLTLTPEAAAAFTADPLLRDRFAGVLVFGEEAEAAGFPAATDMAAVCSRRYETAGGCMLVATLDKQGGKYTLTGQAVGGGKLVDGFIPWLNDRASKLAEPLGDFEEIEIVPIQQAPEGQ